MVKLYLIAVLTTLTITGSANVSSQWIGNWLVVVENGVDISSKGVTYVISENSISQLVPGLCEETAVFLNVSGNNFTTKTSKSNCPWSSPGKVTEGNISFEEGTLILSFPEHGKRFIQKLRKIILKEPLEELTT